METVAPDEGEAVVESGLPITPNRISWKLPVRTASRAKYRAKSLPITPNRISWKRVDNSPAGLQAARVYRLPQIGLVGNLTFAIASAEGLEVWSLPITPNRISWKLPPPHLQRQCRR